MKAKDLRERSTEDLAELKGTMEKDLFSHRMKNATDQLGDTSLLGKARKDIARVELILSERRASAKSSAASGKGAKS
jgi:large subunit ribosomal protein L29